MSSYHINRYNRLKQRVDKVRQDMRVMVDGGAWSSPFLVKTWMDMLVALPTDGDQVQTSPPNFDDWEGELNRILKGDDDN